MMVEVVQRVTFEYKACSEPLKFHYLGHDGVIRPRRVSAPKIDYGTSSFYPDHVGWFLTAFDQDKQAIRSFRMDRMVAHVK